jgi:predicted alpha/beta hydrolase family esterase
MKHALFLHGTSGSPNDHWWPWLKNEFEKSGYEVWAPSLPSSHRPSAEKYWDFLRSTGWDFTDSVLVGHSSGATSVLNLLERPEFPKVKAVVLVGVFLNQRLTSASPDFNDDDQFVDLFPSAGFNWPVVQSKAERFYFVHGDDDPYCSYDDAIAAVEQVAGEMVTIPRGGHLSTSSGKLELPEITTILRRDAIL